MLGIFQHLYGTMEKLLSRLDTNLKIEEWPTALNFQRSAYWASFNGNEVKVLLTNVDTFRRILKRDRKVFELDIIKEFLVAFEIFNEIREACFGMYLNEDRYVSLIHDFAYHFTCIENYFKDVDGINITVFLKLHILYVHVPQFLETQNTAKLENDPNWIAKGLGWWVSVYKS